MGWAKEFVRGYLTLLTISVFIAIVVSIEFVIMFLPMIVAYLLHKSVTDVSVLIAEFLWLPIGAIIVIKFHEIFVD